MADSNSAGVAYVYMSGDDDETIPIPGVGDVITTQEEWAALLTCFGSDDNTKLPPETSRHTPPGLLTPPHGGATLRKQDNDQHAPPAAEIAGPAPAGGGGCDSGKPDGLAQPSTETGGATHQLDCAPVDCSDSRSQTNQTGSEHQDTNRGHTSLVFPSAGALPKTLYQTKFFEAPVVPAPPPALSTLRLVQKTARPCGSLASRVLYLYQIVCTVLVSTVLVSDLSAANDFFTGAVSLWWCT